MLLHITRTYNAFQGLGSRNAHLPAVRWEGERRGMLLCLVIVKLLGRMLLVQKEEEMWRKNKEEAAS